MSEVVPGMHRPAYEALIDLGSNTIRFVVYDRASPLHAPLINERAAPRLALDRDAAGNLAAERIAQALSALKRFARYWEGVQRPPLRILVTAATRDAPNAGELLGPLKTIFGHQAVEVISGAREAELAASGVMASIPNAAGIVADQGGGSLQLARCRKGRIKERFSAPLGLLALTQAGGQDVRAVKALVNPHLKPLTWLSPAPTLYLVGGGWRALARSLMEKSGYPLALIHHYQPDIAEVKAHCRWLMTLSEGQAEAQITTARRSRRRRLPWSAATLLLLLKQVKPERLVFSGRGIRDGFVAERLGLDLTENPERAAVEALLPTGGRFAGYGAALEVWAEPLIAAWPEPEQRWAKQALRLADFGWTQTPTYLPSQHSETLLHSRSLPHSHVGRAFLATALAWSEKAEALQVIPALLDEAAARRARSLGKLMRLAEQLSGRIPALLTESCWQSDGEALRLVIPAAWQASDTQSDAQATEQLWHALCESLDRPVTLDLQ